METKNYVLVKVTIFDQMPSSPIVKVLAVDEYNTIVVEMAEEIAKIEAADYYNVLGGSSYDEMGKNLYFEKYRNDKEKEFIELSIKYIKS